MEIMAKKQAQKQVGRPHGPEKKALNIFLPIEKIQRLKDRSIREKRNISAIVEIALDKDED